MKMILITYDINGLWMIFTDKEREMNLMNYVIR